VRKKKNGNDVLYQHKGACKARIVSLGGGEFGELPQSAVRR
jgi:hypothetical protein